jgi:alanyl-tRNA synthetase
MRNHTGTHLLHAALRQVLGPHVKQAGSLVAPDRLRFDFSHYAALDPEEVEEIERLANEHILRDAAVTGERMDLEAALNSGALAFFGDKYPEKNVRVITIADEATERGFFSKELCGGTHVQRTGQIGVLKVVSESSVAAGTRRIEAITGEAALENYGLLEQSLKAIHDLATKGHEPLFSTLHELVRLKERKEEEKLSKQGRENFYDTGILVRILDTFKALQHYIARTKELERETVRLRNRLAHQQVDELVQRVRRVKDVPVLAEVVEDVDRSTMRSLVDVLRQKLGSGVIALGASADGKVALVVAVTKDLTKKLHAGKIVQQMAGRVGGSGGGRPDLAEAGGKDARQLHQALEDVYAIVEKML